MKCYNCNISIKNHIERVDKLVIGDDGEIKTETPSDSLPSCGHDREYGVKVYQFLTAKNFLSTDSDIESFLFFTGCTSQKPKKVSQLKWLKTKQLLRETLQLMYADMVDASILNFSAVAKSVPICFIDKNGKKYALSSNKPVPSLDSDSLSSFFSEL